MTGVQTCALPISNIEAQMVNLADAIAYNSHDVDDGLRSGFITIEQLRETRLFKTLYSKVEKDYPNLDNKRTIYEIVRRMIDEQIKDLIAESSKHIFKANPQSIEEIRKYKGSLISFSEDMLDMHLELKRFLRENLYRHYRVHRMSHKAGNVITKLFQSMLNDLRLMPPEYREKAQREEEIIGDSGRARIVSDYVAGMTDRYAIKEYKRIFDPTELT